MNVDAGRLDGRALSQRVRRGVSIRPRQVVPERHPVLAAYRVVPPFLAVTLLFDAQARCDSQGCYFAPTLGAAR
jgi:hypothetical protein